MIFDKDMLKVVSLFSSIELNSSVRVVMSILSMLSEGNGFYYFYGTVRGVAKDTGVSVRAVQDTFNTLYDAGKLHKVSRGYYKVTF